MTQMIPVRMRLGKAMLMASTLLPLAAETAATNNTFLTTWREPREGAFTVGIPVGWRATGAVYRAARLDTRLSFRAESPDGRIQITIGDPNLGPRQVPNPMMGQAGMREGMLIPTGAGGQILLARFQSGAQFARQYAPQLCRGAAVGSSSDLPYATRSLQSQMSAVAARYGVVAGPSVGEAYFRCGEAAGYVYATTFWAGQPGGYGAQTWGVFRIASVISADPAQVGYAAYILHTALETYATDPRWQAREDAQTGADSRAISDMQNTMARNIADYGRRQASAASAGGLNHPNDGKLPTDLRQKWAGEDRLSQQRQDATMGQRWVHNQNGYNVRVGSENSYYYQNKATGEVVPGTESGSPPSNNGQWEQLKAGWQ